jgi:hypothetical protein
VQILPKPHELPRYCPPRLENRGLAQRRRGAEPQRTDIQAPGTWYDLARASAPARHACLTTTQIRFLSAPLPLCASARAAFSSRYQAPQRLAERRRGAEQRRTDIWRGAPVMIPSRGSTTPAQPIPYIPVFSAPLPLCASARALFPRLACRRPRQPISSPQPQRGAGAPREGSGRDADA